jgi:hypothetical protein
MEVKMKSKHFMFLIPLIAMIAIGFLSGNAYSLGHYGIGGSVADCDICHDFAGGAYNNAPAQNLRWVRSPILYPTVISPDTYFINFSGPANSGILADATSPYNGPCEVCHTATAHYRRDGSGSSHFPGTDCTTCHPHFASDIVNYFEPRFIGTQSHMTHFVDPKGPQLGNSACPTCHDAGFARNGSGQALFNDGQPLATTTVCNTCHSKGGAFDGVDDPVIGAKTNWTDCVYEPEDPPDIPPWPYRLKAGKEDWCAGCHDAGTSVINGVSAPNVMGNNTAYGYNVNGHGNEGVLCADCHDFAVIHTDGNARTYSASLNNYRAGYRLNDDMAVPRNGQIGAAAFRLCSNCHQYTEITGSTSNFRDDLKQLQYHDMHLNWWPALLYCDSDFSGTGCSTGACVDSAITCIACHNVHGAKGNGAMIRHGELISSPGTTDKVPALDFHWYEADGVTPTQDVNDSLYGGLLCGLLPDVSYNHVCAGCHGTGELKWNRTPGGPLGVTVEAVWTSDYSDVSKAVFAVGEQVRYHVRFTIVGAGSYFMKSPKTASKAMQTSGAAWKTPLPKTGTLGDGTYEWTWDKTIPVAATPGSGAKVTVRINMLTGAGGTLLDFDKKTFNFSIAH